MQHSASSTRAHLCGAGLLLHTVCVCACRGHSLADPDELRSKEEKARYQARDPIPQLRKYMLEHGLATDADIKAIEKRVNDEVRGGRGMGGAGERRATETRVGSGTACHVHAVWEGG